MIRVNHIIPFKAKDAYQTCFSCILSVNNSLCFFVQFETDSLIDTALSMSEELYNSKYKDKLPQNHKVW